MPLYTKQPSIKDTRIYSGAPDTNYGSLIDFLALWETGPGYQRGLCEFDISDFPGGAIASAKLYLYYRDYLSVFGFPDPVGKTVDCYKLDPDNDGSAWVEAQATWNIYATGEAWDAAGGDYVGDPVSETVPASWGWMEWDIKAIVEDAIENYGDIVKLLLKTVSAATQCIIWYSKDYTGDTSLCPKLVIDYTPVVKPYGLVV